MRLSINATSFSLKLEYWKSYSPSIYWAFETFKKIRKNEVKIKVEAFADRNYNSDLTLVPRNKDKALITDEELIVPHLLQMIIKKKVTTIDGVEVGLKADTFCVHGDNPNVIYLLKNITKKLSENGVEII